MKLVAHVKLTKSGVDLSEDWKKILYQKIGGDYPKFYKMDVLSKLAFLGLKSIEDNLDQQSFSDEDIALIFANSKSSADTDQKFIESYTNENGRPSPSLFVYTLPNILTGELAIYKKWYGENLFFIQEKFDPEFFIEQINFNFSKGVKACLCGWVEANENQEECFLFFVENSTEELTGETIMNLYNQQ